MNIFKVLAYFFSGEKTTYSHKNTAIEDLASDQGIDIEAVKDEVRKGLADEGRVETIELIRHRFHVPLATAWRFVNKIDKER